MTATVSTGIETLAARIATVCLQPAPVHTADVLVHKPSAPVTEQFSDVVVAQVRSRATAASRSR